jgi:hypothetical protein
MRARQQGGVFGLPLLSVSVCLALGLLSACEAGTGAQSLLPGDIISSQDSVTEATVDAVAAVPLDPALLVDPWAGQSTGAVAVYDLEDKSWHGQPFPSDARRQPDGHLDLSGFPPPRTGDPSPLLTGYLEHASQILDGWGVQPTLFVRFDAPLDKDGLVSALAPAQTAPYLLLDVDAASPEYGRRIALNANLSGPQRGQYLESNLLAVQPAWGLPLREGTSYALLVRRSLRDAKGLPLGRAPLFAQVIDALALGKAPDTLPQPLQKLATSLLPLVQAWRDGKVTIPVADLAAATVFTTGHPTAQLQRMAEWVRTKAPSKPALQWKKIDSKDKSFDLYVGIYEGPDFQQGIPPYNATGSGGFVFDADGDPVVQRTVPLRVALAVPVDRTLEVGGKLPVVLSAHGTGGDYLSFVGGGTQRIGHNLAVRGLAVVSIDQPLHGPRCDPPISGDELDFKTFNFLNVSAGLAGFRQSALDTVFLARMVKEGQLDLPAKTAGDEGVALDGGRMAFIGHSQGGLSGALVAAVEPSLRAFVLSGAGAGLSMTILLRKDPMDIAATLSLMLNLDPYEVSELHPTIALVQLVADVTDPGAYAPEVLQRPAGQRPPHVLLTEGLLDAATPSATSEALASGMGLDVLAPLVHMSDAMQAKGTQVLTGPVTHNLTRNGFGVTALVSQWDGADHFVIFDDAKAAQLYTEFLGSTLETGDATAKLP